MHRANSGILQGRIVEEAATETIFTDARLPYTRSIVGFVRTIPLVMRLEASLSFLGLGLGLGLGIGVPPPVPSWGKMINVGMNFMYFYGNLAVFPTAALAITVLATTLFGDGLRDALDPTLKGR